MSPKCIQHIVARRYGVQRQLVTFRLRGSAGFCWPLIEHCAVAITFSYEKLIHDFDEVCQSNVSCNKSRIYFFDGHNDPLWLAEQPMSCGLSAIYSVRQIPSPSVVQFNKCNKYQQWMALADHSVSQALKIGDNNVIESKGGKHTFYNFFSANKN